MLRLLAMLSAMLTLTGYPADDSAEEHSGPDAQDCLALSSAVSSALLRQPGVCPGHVHPDGCFIWQQPGVALTVTGIVPSLDEPVLYYDPERLHLLLEAMPARQSGNPFIHPPEPDGEFHLEPQLWLLNATESQSRLAEYMKGYEYWIELNPGGSFIVPDPAALQTDCALVFIDSSGPIEFHFQRAEDGELRLRHVFIWEFFSA